MVSPPRKTPARWHPIFLLPRSTWGVSPPFSIFRDPSFFFQKHPWFRISNGSCVNVIHTPSWSHLPRAHANWLWRDQCSVKENVEWFLFSQLMRCRNTRCSEDLTIRRMQWLSAVSPGVRSFTPWPSVPTDVPWTKCMICIHLGCSFFPEKKFQKLVMTETACGRDGGWLGNPREWHCSHLPKTCIPMCCVKDPQDQCRCTCGCCQWPWFLITGQDLTLENAEHCEQRQKTVHGHLGTGLTVLEGILHSREETTHLLPLQSAPSSFAPPAVSAGALRRGRFGRSLSFLGSFCLRKGDQRVPLKKPWFSRSHVSLVILRPENGSSYTVLSGKHDPKHDRLFSLSDMHMPFKDVEGYCHLVSCFDSVDK